MATFDASEIISLSYSASSPDIGFSGISTSSISVTVANKLQATPACQKGDKVVVSGDGLFPSFFVQDRNFNTDTTSFTAYDSCSKLDKEFDNSNFDDFDYQYDEQGHATGKTIKYYNQTAVITAMNTQLGFTVTPPTDIGIKFQKSDLSGTCRSILEQISQINGCMFICTTSDTIMAVLYKDYAATANISSYGEVLSDNSLVSFDGLVVRDTTFSKEYHYGSNSIFRYIDSALVKDNSNVGGALYTRFRGASYSSFSMSNAKPLYFAANVPQQITYSVGDASVTAIVLNVSATYTADGWLAQYSSPECQPADNTYQSKDQRLMDLLVKNGKHGNILVDENFFGVTYEGV